jgi:hypothetical protein
VNEDGENRQESDAEWNGRNGLLKSHGRWLEVKGLGFIAALIVAFWSLVSDGTLPLSQYLVFLSLMLVSAGGMVWRIWKLNPEKHTKASDRLQPGVYRVSFGDRG